MRYDLLHPKALRAALLKAKIRGVPSEHQVRNWTSGRTPVPEWVRPHIERLVALPEIQEEAAPSMTERLELIEAILRSTALVSGVTPAELEAIEEAHQRALALRRSQQQSGGRNPKGGRHPAGT